jgi:hypothetical protein
MPFQKPPRTTSPEFQQKLKAYDDEIEMRQQEMEELQKRLGKESSVRFSNKDLQSKLSTI